MDIFIGTQCPILSYGQTNQTWQMLLGTSCKGSENHQDIASNLEVLLQIVVVNQYFNSLGKYGNSLKNLNLLVSKQINKLYYSKTYIFV
jgi:hypothetical protein